MDVMDSILALGAVSIVGAIVAGGLKAAGVELPAVSSRARQCLLAAVGVVLMAIGGYPRYAPEVFSSVDAVAERRAGIVAYDMGEHAQALKRFATAAKAGDPEAQYHYGEMLFHGEGIVANREAGLRWVTASADAGFALAQSSLASAYLSGKEGVPKDESMAKKLAMASANQGDPSGMFVLAQMKTSFFEKERDFRAAAEAGHVHAQRALALEWVSKFNETKRGMHRDEAIRWAQRAFDQGDVLSACMLCVLNMSSNSLREAYSAALICESRWVPTDVADEEAMKPMHAVAKALVMTVANAPHATNTGSPQHAEFVSKMTAALPPSEVIRATRAAKEWKPRSQGITRHTHFDWRGQRN